MPLVFKKIVASLVLTSFLAVIFLSFPMMMGAADGSMPEGCPFSATGVSLCPTDTVAMAAHHISVYQSFLMVTLHSEMALLLASLLLLAIAFLAFFIRPQLFTRPILAGIAFDSPPAEAGERKIMRWLSLFENSPSYAVSA